MFNQKLRIEFKFLIGKLKDKTFDEQDINQLFINLRPFFKNEPLIFEIASFFAHRDERDRGISHQAIDINYFKIKSVVEKPKVNLIKIHKSMFDIFIRGIDDISGIDLKNWNLNSNSSIKLIKKSYKKSGSYYVLHDLSKHNEIAKIIEQVFSWMDARIILDEKHIVKALKNALKKISKELKLNVNINEIINSCQNDILICIMNLLNFCEFKLYDNNTGRLILNGNDLHKLNLNSEVKLGKKPSSVLFPFMQLNIELREYLNTKIDKSISDFSNYKLIRDSDNKLKFKNYS